MASSPSPQADGDHDRSHASHFYMLAGSIVGAAHAADPGMGVFATTSNERTADYQQLLSKHS